MRIVHINTSDFGGAAMAAIRLHLYLLEHGVESDLLTLNKSRLDIPRHHQIQPFELRKTGVFFYKIRRLLEKLRLVEDRSNQPKNLNLKGRSNIYEIFTLPFSMFSLARHPLVKSADLVHLHWVSYGTLDEKLFFSECQKPIAWTMHDMHPLTGGCHHADNCEGYKFSCLNCPQLEYPQKANQYWSYKQSGARFFLSRSNAIVCPSEWLALKVKESSLWRKTSPYVIPNGHDSGVFHFRDKQWCREDLGLPLDKKIILFNAFDISNPRKGISVLMEAFNQMNRQDIFLVAIGNQALLKSKNSLLLTGYLTDAARIAMYYSAADIFVLPSMAENLPNTIAESLMCGTPCVASNVGGVGEMLGESNGIKVNELTSSGFRDAIESAVEHNWDNYAISIEANVKYAIDKIGPQYISLYENLI